MATSYPPRIAEVRALVSALIAPLPFGATLPPERELAARWGCSRMTLRRAMDDLVVGGVLTRRQGSGTTVVRPRVDRRLSITSFTEDMRRQGKTAAAKILEFRARRATRADSLRLRVPIGEPLLTFVRLRLADDQPMIVESSMMRASMVPGLTAEDLEGSWYELLAVRFGIHIESATFNVQPVIVGPRFADWLDIDPAQPCLRLQIDSLDARGRIVEAGEATYRGDTYSLTAELSDPHLSPLSRRRA